MTHSPPIGNRAESLLHLWSVRLPRRLDPWTPRLADALADGLWSGVWRPVGAYGPLVAFVAGFLIPASWPGTRFYSESLLFLALAVTLPVLSGSVGVLLLAGHVTRALLGADVASSLEVLFHRGGGLLVSFLLLALPTVILPSLARVITEASLIRIRHRLARAVELGGRAALMALVYAGLVFLWCQAMIVLIRPLFVWIGRSPTYEAIRHVQEDWSLLCWLAAGAAVVRIVLGFSVAPRAARAPLIRALRRQRSVSQGRPSSPGRKLPALVRVALATAGITLLLAGTYESWLDPLVAAVAVAAFAALHEGLLGIPMAGWSRAMHRIPAPARFVAAFAIGYLLAYLALRWMWSADSLRSVLFSALLTLGAFYLFFPRRQPAVA